MVVHRNDPHDSFINQQGTHDVRHWWSRDLFSIAAQKRDDQAHTLDSRTEDNLEVCLAVVADRVSRAAILDLVWVCPTLAQWAVPREASFARTLLRAFAVGNRVGSDTNVAIAALHNRKIISSTLLAGVLAVAEFEKSLNLPLGGSAPFCVAGETHAEVFERCLDCDHFLGCNVCWLRAFDHFEAAGDLVESNLLGERTVVPDIDVERRTCVAFDESVVNWSCCSRQGEQRSEEPALGVHFDCSDCDDSAEK